MYVTNNAQIVKLKEPELSTKYGATWLKKTGRMSFWLDENDPGADFK